MRLLSSLFVGALGAVIAAAPAAPLPARAPQSPSPARASRKPEQPKRTPAVGHVVLRSQNPQAEQATIAAGEPGLTPQQAPHLLGRHLPAQLRPLAPCLKSTGDDLRAGLLALPPPTA